MDLFRFIHWVMTLPAEMEQNFWSEVEKIEEATKMPYLMDIEVKAMEKGELKQARANTLKIITKRFPNAPQNLLERVESVNDLSVLETLFEIGLTANAIDEVEQYLAQLS